MVRAHWSLQDGGPKTYRKRETLTTTVDRHDYSLLKLVDFIGENFVWGSKKYISLWRAVEDDCIEITSDEQLSEWFELNKDKGEVILLVKSMTLKGHCSSHRPSAGFTLLFGTFRVLHLLIWILS